MVHFMPAKPLTPEQKEDAARLKTLFKAWQADMRDQGKPIAQDAAAAKLGFGQSALSQYLNGAIPLNGQVLRKFADLLGVAPEAISPSIADSEVARSSPWVGPESFVELEVRKLFEAFGISMSSAHYRLKDAPAWVRGAAGSGKDFVPDFRADMPDGTSVFVEVKSRHVGSVPPFLEALQETHPRDFLLLRGSPLEILDQARNWLTQRDSAPSTSAQQVAGPGPEHRHEMRNRRPVWVVGMTQAGMTERIWTDGDYPAGELEYWADVSTTDEHAFACRVVGDSMVPRYMPGEYALVEPNTAPELEDDVLVRLATGQTMLKRLLSRRGGIRLGSYNSAEVMTFREDEVTWIYYVAHPIPTRRIKQRIDLNAYEELDRRTHSEPIAVEHRVSARKLGGDGENASKDEPLRRAGGQS